MLAKARFWEQIQDDPPGTPLNERQRQVLNRLLDGSEGKLTTSKYAKLTNSSQDTAMRDILPLVEPRHSGPQSGRRAQHQLRLGRVSRYPALTL